MKHTLRLAATAWIAAITIAASVSTRTAETNSGPVDAPAGFDGQSNGFLAEFCANQARLVNSPNSPMIPDDECNAGTAIEEFTGPETPDDGLGPIFNAEGCGTCHLDPVLGGGSQIMEKRAGRYDGGTFFEHAGGSLIHDRSLVLGFQELVHSSANVVAFRATIGVLGDGFVEAIANGTLEDIADKQPSAQRGELISVPVLERPGQNRIGRFGWKAQHASLVSFSADAYKNEMGITSPLDPVENTSNGTSVEDYDLPGVDDEGVDVELFALFMRDTKAPPRLASLANTSDARAGEEIFKDIGCATCHTPRIVTAPAGTLINGGALKVANALGNKVIRPFGDFLLHDIGTGDGIVQNGGPGTRNKVRTAPLWGLHTRGRFMHDAMSFSLTDAINRHRNQASAARNAFNSLGTTSRNRLVKFLLSL
jgi:CxxC motif-containing protein (DUF1111 family)